MASVHSDNLTHLREHLRVEEAVLSLDDSGSLATHAGIFQVADIANLQSAVHEGFLNESHLGNVLLNCGIDLLPESRYAAHDGGSHLLDSLLNEFRVLVDIHADTLGDSEVGPCTLKDVRQRQEAERNVVLRVVVEASLVHCNSCIEVVVGKNHTLGHTRGARSVDEAGNVGRHGCIFATLHLAAARSRGCSTKLQQAVPRDSGGIIGFELDVGAIGDDLLQSAVLTSHLASNIVVFLAAHAQNVRPGVGNDVINFAL